MHCAWKELLGILPMWMRSDVDRIGCGGLQELRLRMHAPPELCLPADRHWISREVNRDDLTYIINAASRYSPWSASTMAQGYITACGGHRIGICGEAVLQRGQVTGIREISSLCIRVARDFWGIAEKAMLSQGSVIGAPGWGKTTLLRDLIRKISDTETVSVVDERAELFPEGFTRGKRMDVLTGCSKQSGIGMVLKTMGPSVIAVDEITSQEDCCALIQAANCGVRLLATAHASSCEDFLKRIVYRPLIEQQIFSTLLVLHADKSYAVERVS